jgi:hypothetical protein
MEIIKCPICGAPLQFKDENFGNHVRCYQCRCKFVLHKNRSIEMLEQPQNPNYKNFNNPFNTPQVAPAATTMPENLVQVSTPKSPKLPAFRPKSYSTISTKSLSNTIVEPANLGKSNITNEDKETLSFDRNYKPNLEKNEVPVNRVGNFNPLSGNKMPPKVTPFPPSAPTVVEPIDSNDILSQKENNLAAKTTNNNSTPVVEKSSSSYHTIKFTPIKEDNLRPKATLFTSSTPTVADEENSNFNNNISNNDIKFNLSSSNAPTVADEEISLEDKVKLQSLQQPNLETKIDSLLSSSPTVTYEENNVSRSNKPSINTHKQSKLEAKIQSLFSAIPQNNSNSAEVTNEDSLPIDDYEKEYSSYNNYQDATPSFLAKLGFLTTLGVRCTVDFVILVVTLLVVGFFVFNTIYLWTYRKDISAKYRYADEQKNKQETLTKCQTNLIKNYNYTIEYAKDNNNTLPKKQQFFKNYTYQKSEPRVKDCPWKFRDYEIHFNGETLDNFTKKSSIFFACPYHEIAVSKGPKIIEHKVEKEEQEKAEF